jgi:hypothetical protein
MPPASRSRVVFLLGILVSIYAVCAWVTCAAFVYLRMTGERAPWEMLGYGLPFAILTTFGAYHLFRWDYRRRAGSANRAETSN